MCARGGGRAGSARELGWRRFCCSGRRHVRRHRAGVPRDRRHERVAGALSGERRRGSIARRGEGRGPPAPVAVMRRLGGAEVVGARVALRRTQRNCGRAARMLPGLAWLFLFPSLAGRGANGAARKRRRGAVAAAPARRPAACVRAAPAHVRRLRSGAWAEAGGLPRPNCVLQPTSLGLRRSGPLAAGSACKVLIDSTRARVRATLLSQMRRSSAQQSSVS